MINKYFPDEIITDNDLYFVCYMIERVARHINQRNKYVVNALGGENLYHLLSCANVLHCEAPQQIESDWIENYHLETGDFDITDVDPKLASIIPDPLDMGAVYCRLILQTLSSEENLVEGIMRVYNDPICEVIDNYNCRAFYEPSYVIARAYQNGGF